MAFLCMTRDILASCLLVPLLVLVYTLFFNPIIIAKKIDFPGCGRQSREVPKVTTFTYFSTWNLMMSVLVMMGTSSGYL